MKTSRLLTYAIGGIIAGLLFENAALRLRQKATKKADKVKKDISKAAYKAANNVEAALR